MQSLFTKYISLVLCLFTFISLSAQEEFQGLDIWEQTQVDTFPYLKTHEAIEKLADISAFTLYMYLKMNEEQDKGLDTKDLYAQAYYYALLAKRFDFCDKMVASLSPTDTAYTNLLGHIALRKYYPCLEGKTEECDSIQQEVLPILKEAAQKSKLMPKGQWQFLYNYFTDKLKQAQSDVHLEWVDDGIQNATKESWEGGVLKFSLTPGKQNLLVSNGTRKLIQILQLNENDQWEDITASTGLAGYPGGHWLYAIDFNSDGWDDLFILRKKSNIRSEVKYYPSLLLNEKNGKFKDVSKELGLEDVGSQNCACWEDIDGDGRPDVFIGTKFTGSKWMVQGDSGKFVNQSLGYNVLTRKRDITDCFIEDFNLDTYKDLFLSTFQDSNLVFQHQVIDEQYHIFGDETDSYDLKEPFYSKEIIPFDYNLDGRQEMILQADYFSDYDAVAEILNQEDTISAEASFLLKIEPDTTYKMIVNPELGLVRAGVVVQSPEGNYIIGGGGQNTESIYPAFVYHFSENGQSLEVATPEKWPVYIHSATVYADSLNQPVLVFKGGGNYPFMTNHLSSYRIKMPNPGKFVRIFDTGKVKSFSKVTLTYTSPQKEKKDIVIKVKTPDSRGYNAMQEWLWIPEGGQIEDIRYESKDVIVTESEVTPSKNDSNKKKKKNK